VTTGLNEDSFRDEQEALLIVINLPGFIPVGTISKWNTDP